MANTLNLFRNGAVGFIDWLDAGVAIAFASVELWVDSKCEQKPDSKPSQIGFRVREHPELRPRQCNMILCVRVIDEIDSDDTPGYANRSNQEEQ